MHSSFPPGCDFNGWFWQKNGLIIVAHHLFIMKSEDVRLRSEVLCRCYRCHHVCSVDKSWCVWFIELEHANLLTVRGE